jgi:nucleotide-binding universal stress UspA family protein
MTSPATRPRILVAWDGSTAAASALPTTQKLARQLGAAVEILRVFRDNEEAAREGDRREREARRMGLRLRSAIGDAAREIVHATEEPDVLLVALTTHGRELEARYRLGSVAEAVISGTVKPVLIIKPEVAPSASPAGLQRLLVPIDGAPKTASALHPVTELAADLGASIDLLYVTGPGEKPPDEPGSMTAPRYIDQPQHEWPAWASEIVDRLATCCAGCPESVPVHIHLRQGDVGEEIARFAWENHSDAIVLVRRSRFQPGHAMVIRSVLSRTSCFVIVVGGEEL